MRADLHEGDWLDVMDHDGVWSVARVLSVPSPDAVEVTYDGWPSDYDEVVTVDSDRVAPYHTYTWAVKCWVKYLNWPLWPSVATIRSPGTEAGMRNLNKENRLHVDFMDSSIFAKRARVWLLKGHVKLFAEKHDERRINSNGNQFEQAYGFVLLSETDETLPKFVPRGTLPMKFKDAPADSVKMKRKTMGDDEWFAAFAKNQNLHLLTHQYVELGVDGVDGDDTASIESVDVDELKLENKKQTQAKRVKVSTVPKRESKMLLKTMHGEATESKPKRQKLSTAAKRSVARPEKVSTDVEQSRETVKSRQKLPTNAGDDKATRTGKRTKMTTAVRLTKVLPTSNGRRLLCVKK
ncbi:hypothetical protein PHMEG_00025728 [Phytophthora megakarya]|uniref:PWWP domain-containing protein n=1 Tax=Phytophthora megakarya TaxID=4795 RepID=A0A225VAZ1_9STRA|nr:hypothetical protein PHMEG_00025728 [Phytophthora megakarya]